LPTRLKVCCIESEDEARLAVRLGASALGLVSSMPSGPGVIGEDSIRRIAETAPPGVATFLLTSATSVAEIEAQQRRCRTNTIQICDRLKEGRHADLKAGLPGVKVVQVVHVVDGDAVEEAVEAARGADAILLDSGRPGAAVLRPTNVGEAIRAVRPFGIDVCSGVRTHGRLDEGLLRPFAEAMSAADAVSA
jgi:phosphoribosylanthranilate isomerase